jgi:hypothetical protein
VHYNDIRPVYRQCGLRERHRVEVHEDTRLAAEWVAAGAVRKARDRSKKPKGLFDAFKSDPKGLDFARLDQLYKGSYVSSA